MGAQSQGEDGVGVLSGDNTAYSVLVSRYMQAIQHEHGGVTLDTLGVRLMTVESGDGPRLRVTTDTESTDC